MCISGCSVGTVLSLFSSAECHFPQASSVLLLSWPKSCGSVFLLRQWFFNLPERSRVCVCAFMHPCICVKTAQADNAWPDLKVMSLTCSADWTCEAIRSTAIFLPRVVWIPEGFTRTMMRVGCLFLDVFCFNDMAAVCADGHMDVFSLFFSLFAYFHQPTWDCSIWEWILSEIYSPSERLCYWRVSVVGFTHHSCATAQLVTFTQCYLHITQELLLVLSFDGNVGNVDI